MLYCRLVKDIVTGKSKQYAFVEYESTTSMENALTEMHKEYIDGSEIVVEKEAQRTLAGWVPRRLGGGFGGRKEAGQLRFGCRDRPFHKPIIIRHGNEGSHKYLTICLNFYFIFITRFHEFLSTLQMQRMINSLY